MRLSRQYRKHTSGPELVAAIGGFVDAITAGAVQKFHAIRVIMIIVNILNFLKIAESKRWNGANAVLQ
jgi:hypothetical protein